MGASYSCQLSNKFLFARMQDDILTADFCPPCYLATGSFDGEIIVWLTDTERLFKRLRTAPSEFTTSHGYSNIVVIPLVCDRWVWLVHVFSSDRGVGSKQFDRIARSGMQGSGVIGGLTSQRTMTRSRRMSRTTQRQVSGCTSRVTSGYPTA